jgi:predicted nucleic acid-binding Zn ribbon protein
VPEDHHHCKVCGKVCAADAETCSKACRLKREGAAQTRKMYSYLLYGIMALLVILLVAGYYR